MMAVDGKHGVGRALDVLSVYDRLGCDVIGLQKTRRSGHSAFSQSGYLVYCSGECGDENCGKKGQGGVGLAMRTTVTGTGVMSLVGEPAICHIIHHSSLIFDYAVCWWRSWASSVFFCPHLRLMLMKIRAVARACQSASPCAYVFMFQG